jgi:hypothetical protein
VRERGRETEREGERERARAREVEVEREKEREISSLTTARLGEKRHRSARDPLAASLARRSAAQCCTHAHKKKVV